MGIYFQNEEAYREYKKLDLITRAHIRLQVIVNQASKVASTLYNEIMLKLPVMVSRALLFTLTVMSMLGLMVITDDLDKTGVKCIASLIAFFAASYSSLSFGIMLGYNLYLDETRIKVKSAYEIPETELCFIFSYHFYKSALNQYMCAVVREHTEQLTVNLEQFRSHQKVHTGIFNVLICLQSSYRLPDEIERKMMLGL